MSDRTVTISEVDSILSYTSEGCIRFDKPLCEPMLTQPDPAVEAKRIINRMERENYAIILVFVAIVCLVIGRFLK